MVSFFFFGVLALQLFPMVSPSFSRSLAIFARRLSSSCRSRLTLAAFSAEFAEPGERKYGRNGKHGWWWSLLLLLLVVVVMVVVVVLVLLWLLSLLNTSTSSAAQGGGGSFKNKKPAGEVGCCESRMRIHWWTERLCFLERLQWLQWSPGRWPHPQLLDVASCSAAVVVVVA